MYGINFLEHRQKKLSKLERQDQTILKVIGILFGVICLVIGVLLGIQFLLQQRIKTVEARQKELEQQVLSQEETEEAFLFYVNKLDTLQMLFKQRKDKQTAIDYFAQVFGPSVLIENIAYNARDGVIEFGLKSTDVFVLESVFSSLQTEQTTSLFSEVKKSDLRRLKDGTYSMQVTVTFSQDEEQNEN